MKNKYIIGVSGGADSMCLLHKMHKSGKKIVVAHFNHNLRKVSKKDEEFVKQFCITNKITFFSREIDVKKYARSNKISIETAGRILRYIFFADLADKLSENGYNPIIMTAHNKNDNVETFFMHLFRGSGLRGLCGIKEKSEFTLSDGRKIQLERPLLNINREEINKYNTANNVPFIFDETNNDIAYERNKIRLELMPIICKANKLNAIEKTIKNLQIDEIYLEETVSNLITNNVIENTFLVEWFNKLNISLKRRVILLLTSKLTEKTISTERIDNAIKAITKNYGGKIIQFPDEIELQINKGKIKICQKK